QEVDSRPLDRREDEPEVPLAVLRAAAFAHRQRAPALAEAVDAGLPLAVAPIEQRDRRAGFEAQHVAQIVSTRVVEAERAAGGEIVLDIEPSRRCILHSVPLSAAFR